MEGIRLFHGSNFGINLCTQGLDHTKLSREEHMLYVGQQLSFAYGRDHKDQVLNSVDVEITRGEGICLTGPSGSGKSTLLHLLGLIEAPQDGQLLFLGKPVHLMKEDELNDLRRFHIGFVFQDFQLIDVLSVEENVEFFLTRQQIPKTLRKERVEQALQDLGLWEHRFKRPHELSGGQKQRVAVARALAKHPLVVVADEPTASLDSKTGRQLMENLKAIQEQRGVTLILASHDPMVLEFGLREIRLRDGRLNPPNKGTRYVG
ncbi:MAG TPA: ABC transporter ATP-binding protein [Oligoflexus sp.]|uniref:ABC transporter ATP-binding protein n=1 Tax=Oligoflexus sp. TaxID=1971216 RepID=UPI002D220E98|nr:ABC transporter ATP-binding protein [Oligoflexus sp.]HYX35944.1 ABC transporter ATP-binding protein [Oligoflexus sp.]